MEKELNSESKNTSQPNKMQLGSFVRTKSEINSATKMIPVKELKKTHSTWLSGNSNNNQNSETQMSLNDLEKIGDHSTPFD